MQLYETLVPSYDNNTAWILRDLRDDDGTSVKVDDLDDLFEPSLQMRKRDSSMY